MKPFKRAFKEEWSQLQFSMQHVEKSLDYPLGVKTTYRAYAADTTFEIYHKTEIPFHLQGIVCSLILFAKMLYLKPTIYVYIFDTVKVPIHLHCHHLVNLYL